MIKPNLLIVAAVSLMVTTIAAESSIRERDPKWRAPESAVVRRNPLAGRSDVSRGGQKIFEDRCATCHARGAGGSRRAPDLLSPGVQAQTDGALFWKIGSGNTHAGMPSFSFLPELQRWQLVLYLRAIRD